MSGPFSSALINEAVSRITSLLTGKYSEHSNIQEWIDRLVMAKIQIESALLESEEFDINNEEPLHKWQEKLKEALCEAEELLNNFPEFLHEEPNQTIEGGHTASNLGEAVTRQVDLEANLPHDPFMQEEGSDDPTLVHPASNFKEAVTRQVDLEENLPHDPFMQEEGSDDATFVHTASNLREAVTRQVDLQENLPHDQPMQEEGSDGANLVHPSLLKAVIHRIELQANWIGLCLQIKRYVSATMWHIALNPTEAVTRQVDLQANLPHDQPMQEEGSDLATLMHWCLNRLMRVTSQLPIPLNLYKFSDFLDLPLQERKKPSSTYFCKKWVNEYLESDKNVSKLKNTVEKLEKMAGNIGNFIKLLELQKKRKMSRKRKRSGVALQVFFLVLSLKLQTYALFCYGEDTYLLVTKMFRANCTVPAAITGDIFIGFIM